MRTRQYGAPYWTGHDYAKKLVRLNGRFNVLDAYGGSHQFGSGPHVDAPYWPGWPVARDIRKNPDGPGGYLLDAYGGIWPVGGAPTIPGVPYFGRDRARGVVLLPGGGGTPCVTMSSREFRRRRQRPAGPQHVDPRPDG